MTSQQMEHKTAGIAAVSGPRDQIAAERAETAALLHDDRFTGRFIEDFVYSYTFESDDGTHIPGEAEQAMLMDCCVGLVTELLGEEFRHFCYAALADVATEKVDRGDAKDAGSCGDQVNPEP
jgi:hypothetical protein